MERCGTLLLVALLAPQVAAPAELPDGDLAAVRRAVAQDEAGEASPPAGDEPRESPGWIRLQVLDKATGERPVTLSVPLALLDACVGKKEQQERGERQSRLRELLEALGSARSLVEIDSEESEIRIWIE